MNAKLTLTIEASIIADAKKYAIKRKSSLSNIIQNYLKTLTKEEQNAKDINLSPTLKSLKGSYKMPENFDINKELTNILSEKYL